MAAGVGRLDQAVKEEAAVMKRRLWRRRQGPDYKGEQQAKLAKMDKDTKARKRQDVN